MPLVSLLSFFICQERTKYFVCVHISVSMIMLCRNLLNLFESCVRSFPPSAPFPSGLVSLPQIERIQFFQESVKGQEESQVPLGTFRHTTQDPSQHALRPTLHPRQTNVQRMDTPNTHIHVIPLLIVQIVSLPHGSSHALSHYLPTYANVLHLVTLCNVLVLFLCLCRSPQIAFDRVTFHSPFQTLTGQWTV